MHSSSIKICRNLHKVNFWNKYPASIKGKTSEIIAICRVNNQKVRDTCENFLKKQLRRCRRQFIRSAVLQTAVLGLIRWEQHSFISSLKRYFLLLFLLIIPFVQHFLFAAVLIVFV